MDLAGGWNMDNKKERLKRLQRIVDLQHRLKLQHEWQLISLEHQQEQIAKDRNILSEALDQPMLSGERLLDLVGKQLSETNRKEQIIAGAKVHHRYQHEEQHRRLKFVEKVHQKAVTSHQRDAQQQELSEIIDIALLERKK